MNKREHSNGQASALEEVEVSPEMVSAAGLVFERWLGDWDCLEGGLPDAEAVSSLLCGIYRAMVCSRASAGKRQTDQLTR